MRLGVGLHATGPDALGSLRTQVHAAERAGLELGWLTDPDRARPALITAAAVAEMSTALRLVASVPAGAHPLAIAEDAIVADNCSNGRLTLTVEDLEGDAGLLAETTDVLLAALASRPFRHEGERWRIPAGLPENDGREERIVITPPAVQPELPLWLSGRAAAEVARGRALAHLSAAKDDPERAAADWAATDEALGRQGARLRRPALRPLDATTEGEFDDDALVAGLRAEQRAWGLDVAILILPDELDDPARVKTFRRIATHVRPRVTQHELPAGLERHWRERLSEQLRSASVGAAPR